MPPFFTERTISGRISRRKRVGHTDGATDSDTSPSGRNVYCVDTGYDAETGGGRETKIHGVMLTALFRGSQMLRGSHLSYKEARRVRRIALSLSILIATYIANTFFVALLAYPAYVPLRPLTDQSLESLPLLIKWSDVSTVNDMGGLMNSPRPIPGFHAPAKDEISSKVPDYGGLSFRSVVKVPTMEAYGRQIDPNDDLKYDKQRESQLKAIDSPHDHYWNVHQEDTEFERPECRQPSWKSDYYPNCNSFHEFDLSRSFSEYDSHSFGRGSYRDTWLVETTRAREDWVLKMIRYKRKFGGKELDLVQKDALVMEKLASSPRIVDIYGHCATSLNVEAMNHKFYRDLIPRHRNKLREDWDVKIAKSRNKLTNTDKLRLALEMAESVAELHGYKNGVIVHDDLHAEQWLRAKDGKLKLGDFNRAKIVDWNEEEQEYCKFPVVGGVWVSASWQPKELG